MRLSVIIPAYNEAERIPSTLKAVDEYLRKQSYDYEILVVNDGSKDNTAD
ncbi:MAG: glycosyltransferase, partial [bacterium]|nr:glycosyltransferase [bacterium]